MLRGGSGQRTSCLLSRRQRVLSLRIDVVGGAVSAASAGMSSCAGSCPSSSS